MRTRKYWKTLTLMVLLTLQAGSALAGTQQPIEVDKSQGKAPMVTQAGNGVPVVNIRTPNSRGLSHNQYKNFNVTNKGLIFNNSRENVKTQLGGYITKNNYLAGSSAKTILNEVTSNMASKINGFMEIAGQKANLIISNPNGIQINNGGYINVNRGILTTGKPKIGSDGNLNGFSVERGEVDIEGLGFDARQASKSEIYAQAVKLNAKIIAENLNIVTGKNEIDGEGNVTASDNTKYEGVSLDVGAIGGMYAGVIKLVGTAKGLGVNTEGEIYAQRQLVMTEDGRVAVKENGKIVSDGTADIETKAKLVNKGEIKTVGNLDIGSKKIINSGDILSNGNGTYNTITGKIINTGTIKGNADLAFNTTDMNNTNTISSVGDIRMAVTGKLDNTGLVNAANFIFNTERTGTLNNTGTGRIYGDEININAETVNNTAEADADSTPVIASRGNLAINAETVNNKEKALILSLGDMAITAETLNNNSAEIEVGNDLILNVGTLNNTNEHFAYEHQVIDDECTEETEVTNLSSGKVYVIGDGEGEYKLGNFSMVTIDWSQKVTEQIFGSDALNGMQNYFTLRTPNGETERWQVLRTSKKVERDVVLESAPGVITAGGNITYTGNRLTNDKSKIVAVGTLDIVNDGSLYNIDSKLYETVTESIAGVVASYFCCWCHRGHNEISRVKTIKLPEVTLADTVGQANGGEKITDSNNDLIIENVDIAKITDRIYAIAESDANYYIEVDPQFANKDAWLSSDYFFEQMKTDPDKVAKRVGDGFYEQKLIKEQLINSVGVRLLDGYNSDMEQYQWLMDNATAFALATGAEIGRPLTLEEQNQLTEPVVWYETRTMQLSEGRTVTALAPQVYFPKGMVDNISVATLGGKEVNIFTKDDIVNTGTIKSGDVLKITTGRIENIGGTLKGVNMGLEALTDIDNIGGTIMAVKTLDLGAGRDINITSQIFNHSITDAGDKYLATSHMGGTVEITGEKISLNIFAGNNVNVKGSNIVAQGENSTVNIIAVQNVNMLTDEDTSTLYYASGYKNKVSSTDTVTHTGSNITATGNVNIGANNDVNIQTSNIIGTGDSSEVNISAGNNVNVTSTQSVTDRNYNNGQTHKEKSIVNESSAIGGNKVNIGANNDVTLQTANIAASGENAELNIGAGNNINLTASKAVENDYHTISHGYEINNSSQDEGTNIVSDGKLNLVANKDINLKAAYADGDEVNITAGNNINIEAGDATSYYEYYYHKTSRHGLSKKSVTIHDIVSKETKVGTDIGGNTLNIQAGNDINVKGSNVIGVGDVNMLALENANIDSVTEKTGETHIKKVKKSGFLSGGGFGFTIGSQSSTDSLQKVTVTQKGSTVGSVAGDVNITTGEKLNVISSDIIAGGNINLTGSEVKIDAASDTYTYNYKHEEKTSGLHISFGGGVAGTVQENIVQPLERSRQVSNEKLSALYGIKAASKVKETGAVLKDAFTPGTVTKYTGDVATGADGSMTMGTKEVKKDVDWGHINVGFGNSKSTYTEHGESSTAHSSGVSAGEDVNITATEKDIDIKGSNVTGENINLTAKGNVNIMAKENISTFNSKDKKSGSEIGVSFSVNGMSIYGNAYGMKEKGEGTTTTYTGSNVKAENELNITSGADTNIIGSKASGEKVNADVGGNLNIESLQDKETQKWETSGSSISGSIGVSGNVIGNGGIAGQTNKSKMDSDYNSVTEQAGIYAGDRGFDINVEGNTDLKGAVIDSKAGYEDNTLNTGTITFDDIENKAEYSTSGRGVNIQKTFGKGEMTDEQKAWEGVTPSTGIGTKDEDESTTKSAIAEARINIMKPEKQRQDITKLDRNTTKTLNKLGKIFDKEKVEEKQELAGLFQEMWHTTVGDLMAKSHVITDDQRKALNILGGAIAAELGGADFKAGLTGGATTELLQSAFSKIKSQSLRNVAVALVAASVAKGTGQEAATAANVAVAIQKYNHDYHAIAEAIIQNDPKRKNLTGQELDAAINQLATDLENMTKPDAYKITVSGGAFGVGVEKSYIYDAKSEMVYLDDGIEMSVKDFAKMLKAKEVKGLPSLSVSYSSLRIVDISNNKNNLDIKTIRDILRGESIGCSGYYGIGGGISTPDNPQYKWNKIVVEIGFGTPQLNISYNSTTPLEDVIKDNFKRYMSLEEIE